MHSRSGSALKTIVELTGVVLQVAQVVEVELETPEWEPVET